MIENAIIDKIQKVREKNNRLWMDILRIAMEGNKERTKEILKRISENDTRITRLSNELARES